VSLGGSGGPEAAIEGAAFSAWFAFSSSSFEIKTLTSAYQPIK
jgi:hypothetical protein